MISQSAADLCMFAQARYPHNLEPGELDRYLEQGWFRMRQTIFTTNFLNFKGRLYSALWLRVPLLRFTIDKKQQQIFTRVKTQFTTTIQRATIDGAREALFQRYKQNISFEASASLHQLLNGETPYNVYDTHEVSVYDGKKLIASGLFDLGKDTAAGISSFYDPDYRKYSLGKYLILSKMLYCQQQGFKFFYPGYFAPGYSSFDYKLEFGKDVIEYLDVVDANWKAIGNFNPATTPLEMMRARLISLYDELKAKHVSCTFYQYEFFDANLVPELMEADLFDYPLFIYFPSATDAIGLIVVFDVIDQQYHLLECTSLWSSHIHNTASTYSNHLLQISRFAFASATVNHMVEAIASELKRKQVEESRF